ncbi:MAG: hypothetical protein QOG15_3050 [Solirubrobacteraceae bacterium]|nr:hypothetical protein [Solirubrobacteraceae bacterium]
MSPIMRSLILALVAGALLAPAAQASQDQSSIMMDDDLLVYRGPVTAQRAMTQMKALGVDTIRVTLSWAITADKARFTPAEIKKLKGAKARRAAKKQTRRFRAASPKTYPVLNWDRYDDLVRLAQTNGLRVYFNITGPGPAWAHEKPPKSQRYLRKTYKPKPGAFKQFVTAVGKRYSGSYRDENQSKGVLPRVSFWSLWNEPNQAGWLSPQWEKIGGRRILVSAMLFRKLYQAGYKGLQSSGHGIDTDTVLLGETAPLGSTKTNAKSPPFPSLFLRELACIKQNGSKYTGGAARARGCNNFGPKLQANGFAHHPYTKNVPTTTQPPAGGLTMANISQLGTLLDDLSSKSGGKIPADLPLYMTEFGFETNPPDPFNGVPLFSQASFNELGEFLAFSNPRIASQAQFLLRDVAPVAGKSPGTKAYWFTYQSGLYFNNSVPKPAVFAYQLPFIVFPGGNDAATGHQSFSFWGQLRFVPDGTPANAVIQWRPKGSGGAWDSLGTAVPVSTRGYFQTTRVSPVAGPVEWRAAWLTADGHLGVVSLTSG